MLCESKQNCDLKKKFVDKKSKIWFISYPFPYLFFYKTCVRNKPRKDEVAGFI
jgi:hypothetical protein